MTSFDDRERGFETKFARDEEMAFRVHARRNRLVGTWAAGLMGLTAEEAEAYAHRNGIAYQVMPEHKATVKRNSYSDNFRSDRKTPWTH